MAIEFLFQSIQRVHGRADIGAAVRDFVVRHESRRLVVVHLSGNVEVSTEVGECVRPVEQRGCQGMNVQKTTFGPLIRVLWTCERDKR
jgi:hypothetical protein